MDDTGEAQGSMFPTETADVSCADLNPIEPTVFAQHLSSVHPPAWPEQNDAELIHRNGIFFSTVALHSCDLVILAHPHRAPPPPPPHVDTNAPPALTPPPPDPHIGSPARRPARPATAGSARAGARRAGGMRYLRRGGLGKPDNASARGCDLARASSGGATRTAHPDVTVGAVVSRPRVIVGRSW
eukprot:CAMPEP_0172182542 /NCGR_PEP_ID=MMETSP1050-20130122/18458_1 /TAXON_ID=233186 /ORGANISM="Cryptomonas curvata, Strain CCAP979/52" /LENGTH=184 /DNA_ID=CAMNT_0012856001 /DNA_START=81 /DNA_END=634 /DNA_ORIENTATION=+